MSDDPIEDVPDEEKYLDDLQIITLMYDNTGDSPSLDLGTCTPWVAIALFQSAIDTLQMLIPPVSVTYNGKVVASADIDLIDDLDDYDED